MIVTVDVNNIDIRNGIRASSCYCPVARALKRLGYTEPMVENDYVTFQSGDTVYAANLPTDVKAAIVDYDFEGRMFPLKFDLNATPLEKEAAA